MASKRGPKGWKVKPYSLAQHRCRLETEAMGHEAMLRRTMDRATLRYAVSRKIGKCDACSSWSCDVDSAILVGDSFLGCAKCAPKLREQANRLDYPWIWGAELCDAATRTAERILCR